jgi:hypothetical protein
MTPLEDAGIGGLIVAIVWVIVDWFRSRSRKAP